MIDLYKMSQIHRVGLQSLGYQFYNIPTCTPLCSNTQTKVFMVWYKGHITKLLHLLGRRLFKSMHLPRASTVKGDSIKKTWLNLYRANILSAKFLSNDDTILALSSWCKAHQHTHHIQYKSSVWFHQEIDQLQNWLQSCKTYEWILQPQADVE